MTWTACTLDNFPVGNMVLTDDSGFSFNATIKDGDSNEIAKIISIAQAERDAFVAVKTNLAKVAGQILAQAQAAG